MCNHACQDYKALLYDVIRICDGTVHSHMMCDYTVHPHMMYYVSAIVRELCVGRCFSRYWFFYDRDVMCDVKFALTSTFLEKSTDCDENKYKT